MDDDDDDENRCCVCGVDPSKKASNLTKRTLLTNVCRETRCGHRFCNGCVERGVAKKGQFACPRCGAPVRRATLDARTLEDIEVERDAVHRKRVLAVFNAPPESFATPRAYDDYLENVEDAIFALTRGGAAAAAVEKRLAAEAHAHADAVAARAAARISRAREQAAEVEDEKARAADAAAKLRFRRKLDRQAAADVADHALAYALGDRADAPRAQTAAKPESGAALDAKPLPTPVGRPTNPRHVKGAELDRRKRAGGYDPTLHARRDDFELFANCDAADLREPRAPPYAPRALPGPLTPIAAPMDLG